MLKILTLIAVLAIVSLAGCTSSPKAPSELEEQFGTVATGGFEPLAWGACVAWQAFVDAPANTFPAGTSFSPVAGRQPGTIQVQAEAVRCAGVKNELWQGWVVAEGGILLDLLLTTNETHLAAYHSVGAPAELEQLVGYYSTQGPYANVDGLGRSDRSHGVFVHVAQFQSQGPVAPRFFHISDGSGSLEWSLAGGSNYHVGTAELGDTALVGADHWQGTGSRQEGVTVAVAWRAAEA